jgi:hypothetical protein
MKELTKEQKIKVIEAAIEEYRKSPSFLCYILEDCAIDLCYIKFNDCMYIGADKIVASLIPEFLELKPEKVDPEDAWFGSIERGKVKRLNVLCRLYDNIKNNSHE